MTNTLLKTGGTYGAKLGNRQVFTRQGAIDVYKTFLRVAHKDLTMEGARVLFDVESDMVRIGFTWEELEDIEMRVLASM